MADEHGQPVGIAVEVLATTDPGELGEVSPHPDGVLVIHLVLSPVEQLLEEVAAPLAPEPTRRGNTGLELLGLAHVLGSIGGGLSPGLHLLDPRTGQEMLHVELAAGLVPGLGDELVEVARLLIQEGDDVEVRRSALLELKLPDRRESPVLAPHTLGEPLQVELPEPGIFGPLRRVGQVEEEREALDLVAVEGGHEAEDSTPGGMGELAHGSTTTATGLFSRFGGRDHDRSNSAPLVAGDARVSA